MIMKFKQFGGYKEITIFCALLMSVLFYGCEDNRRKCSLIIKNGSGWNAVGTTVECDSFQMDGTRKAFVWVDGCRMSVEANDVILPQVR